MPNNDIIMQTAAKAIIARPDGKILILRESAFHDTNTKAGHYHLVGGRIAAGESFFDGLRREVFEETRVVIDIGRPVLVGEWRPNIRGISHQIIGVYMACRMVSGTVALSDEHDSLRWIEPQSWPKHDIVMPDRDAVAAYAAALT